MKTPHPNSPTSRRAFVKGAIATAGAAVIPQAISQTITATTAESRPFRPPEWRNKQEGMAYRRLGNTGLMVSEIVQGGSGPMNPENYKTFEYSIERGLNYFDTAARYSRGKSEEGLGMLASLPGVRDKIFISTKLSFYYDRLDALAKEIFDGLPGEKQSALRKKAKELIAERGVNKPGYFFPYFPGQERAIEPSYLTHVVKQEYGYQKKWKSILKKEMMESVETSLKRLRTDHVDILHCPHGARIAEDIEDETIAEVFATVKQQGKARFCSLSSHTDAARVLSKAAELPYYDVAMFAYNIACQGVMEPAMHKAAQSGMGLIAMKAAAGVFSKYEQLPIPDWRIQKLNHVIPEEMKIQPKGYLWALQNPNLTAVISEMFDHQMIDDNFAIVGKKVDLNLA